MIKENIIQSKSFGFALDIIELYKLLQSKKEFILSKQLLRSATSIGANVEEAIAAQSKKDFINKLSVSCKEARETRYWLRLLAESKLVDDVIFDKYLEGVTSIINIITKIIMTSKEKHL